MIYVGIDVAKDKHDLAILGSDGEVLLSRYTFPNNRDGFEDMIKQIQSFSSDLTQIKVGLEATGHYCHNLLGFLLNRSLKTFVLNPLHTNLYRKSMSLRKTKTDRVDARTIANMIMSGAVSKPYTYQSYHNEELKSLTRYRFTIVQARAKQKASVARLINILFPELEKMVTSLHIPSVYALLSEFPGASHIAEANIIRLTNLLSKSSKGRYGRENAEELRNAARRSIGSSSPAKSLELKHTITLIRELSAEIDEIDASIKKMMDDIDSPILSIPGISYKMGAMIIAEVGDFSNFDSADKLLAYAGLSPSTYQSGQLTNARAKMEKRGSKYLRYALYNTTKFVCNWEPSFGSYLAKKRAEGKHYNVALSHASKRLVRLIYAMTKSGEPYRLAN